MSQPEWKLLWSTDYSALYEDTTGVYDPELVIAQTDDGTNISYVYRFDLPRLEVARVPDDVDPRIVREYLVAHGWSARTDLPHDISQYDEWFHKDLASVAASHDHASIREDLCSEDVNKRAHAYESIGGHHGYDNLDGSPEEWTEHEFSEFPERGSKYDPDDLNTFLEGYITCALWCGVLDERTICPKCDGAGDGCKAHGCINGKRDPENNLENYSGDDLDESDLDDDARKRLSDDARAFYDANVEDLHKCDLNMEQAGHDFWLTRNRHGAGYWDRKHRGEIADVALDKLTEASHAYGGMDLALGDSGKVITL